MKTTLILLPGLNGTDGLFKPLAECLQDHFDVLSINYPTHEQLSYQQLTELVLDTLTSVKGKYIILGESFSGPISIFVSEKKPEGLIGLILAGTFVTAPSLSIGRYLPWTLGLSIAKPFYSIGLKQSKQENQSLISAIRTELKKVSPRVLSSRIQEAYSVNASEALRRCDIPIVYFRGVNDFVVPKRNLHEILALRPDINVIEFNSHHFFLYSQAEQALREITKFEKQCM